MKWHQEYIAPPCPGCGKPDAARMGKSSWGHDISCCSDACGLRVGDSLERMRADKRYKSLIQTIQRASDQLADLQREHLRPQPGHVEQPQERGRS